MPQILAPIAVILLTAAGIAGSMVLAGPAADGKPLADFGHATHLDRGVECADCHLGVAEGAESAAAGVPSVQVCLELCHGDFDDAAKASLARSPAGRLALEHFERGEEIDWPRAYTLPDHVVFSHRWHVGIAAIPCASCHGDVAATASLPARPHGAVLTMDGCVECHESRGATTDCFACHR